MATLSTLVLQDNSCGILLGLQTESGFKPLLKAACLSLAGEERTAGWEPSPPSVPLAMQVGVTLLLWFSLPPKHQVDWAQAAPKSGA